MGRTCFDGTFPREEASEALAFKLPTKERGSTCELLGHAVSNQVRAGTLPLWSCRLLAQWDLLVIFFLYNHMQVVEGKVSPK